MDTPLRILLVDDNRAFLDLMTEFINLEPAVKLVGCAQSGAEAIELAGRLQPDIVLLDLEMHSFQLTPSI